MADSYSEDMDDSPENISSSSTGRKKASIEESLYQKNKEAPNRQPKYSKTTGRKIIVHGSVLNGNDGDRKKSNQYTMRTFEQYMDETFEWLVPKTMPLISFPIGHFVCWNLDEGIKGVDSNEAGYKRISFHGAKVLAHVFTWLYIHPGEPMDEEIVKKNLSHLCGNAKCCRPSHIHKEPHPTNISRKGCVGFIPKHPDIGPDDDSELLNHFIQVCTHSPTCKKITFVSPEQFDTELDFED